MKKEISLEAYFSVFRKNIIGNQQCFEQALHRLEQLAPDQHAAHFAGAGADLVELGIAQ